MTWRSGEETACVRRWAKRYRKIGDIHDAPRSGRPAGFRDFLQARVIDIAFGRELGCRKLAMICKENY